VPCRGSSQEDAVASSADVVQLCLWSLNPAIAFRDLARGAHSLVLTSGTLAPMDTFASEVGCQSNPTPSDVSKQTPPPPAGPRFCSVFHGCNTLRMRHQSWPSDSVQWFTSYGTAALDTARVSRQLGVPFPIVLEAPHVINMDAQVWARAICQDVNSKPLIVRDMFASRSARIIAYAEADASAVQMMTY